jgi:hypothetical protein
MGVKFFLLNNYYRVRKSWFYGSKFASPVNHNYAEIGLAERLKDPVRLERFGYKVYSQTDEDGILDEIFKRIGTINKKFVEFGVEDGLECNGHFLLHKGWKGLWLEGSPNYCKKISKAFKEPIAQKQLTVINAFIDKDNINDLITEGGMSEEIDLLSIDVDGNDYHIWKAIQCVKPRVVCIEYNAKFPSDFEWVMKYNKNHTWDGSDNQGASLKSLEILGRDLGYQLVATNLNGVNAFFVKNELAKDLFTLPAISENLYNPCRFMIYQSGHVSRYYIGK